MTKSKPYYTLLQRVDGKWQIEFGAYDRKDVIAERDYYRGYYAKAKDLKIITSGDTQSEIQSEVDKVNV